MSKGNKTRWPGWSSEQFLRHCARSEVWEAPLGHGLGAEEDSGLGLALALPSGAPSTKGEAGAKTDWDAGQSEDCDGRTCGAGEGGAPHRRGTWTLSLARRGGLGRRRRGTESTE